MQQPFFIKWSSQKGPFFKLRLIVSYLLAYLPLRRRTINFVLAFLLRRVLTPNAFYPKESLVIYVR